MNGPPGGSPPDGRRPVIINAYPNNGTGVRRNQTYGGAGIRRNQTLSRPDRQPTLRRPMLRTIDRPPPAARAGKT